MTREEIVTEHLPAVAVIARQVRRATGRRMEAGELQSAGHLGLLAAVDGYDPRQAQLSTYADRRIRGAMLDELRRDLHHRRRAQSIEDDDSAAVWTAPATTRPDRVYQKTELRRQLERALAALPSRDARVIRAYYYDERVMREIAAELGLHLTRVKQLLMGAIAHLRDVFRASGIESAQDLRY